MIFIAIRCLRDSIVLGCIKELIIKKEPYCIYLQCRIRLNMHIELKVALFETLFRQRRLHQWLRGSTLKTGWPPVLGSNSIAAVGLIVRVFQNFVWIISNLGNFFCVNTGSVPFEKPSWWALLPLRAYIFHADNWP